MPAPRRFTEHLQSLTTPEQMEAIKGLEETMGVSRAEVVRYLIDLGLPILTARVPAKPTHL